MEEFDEEIGVQNTTAKNETTTDDVDIYEDLETACEKSDVIERFNRRFSPKKCLYEDQYSDEAVSEEDVGLYDDLNAFEKQLGAEELEAKVEVLELRCSDLDKQNAELKSEVEKVNKVNLVLRRNISSIFKTAKAELERKERQLKELQREHDALIFRRGAAHARSIANVVHTTVTNNNNCSSNTAASSSQVLKNEKAKENLAQTEKRIDMNPLPEAMAVVTKIPTERGQRLEVCDQLKRKDQSDSKRTESSQHKPLEPKTKQPLTSKRSFEDGEINDDPTVQSRPHIRERRNEPFRRQDSSNSRRPSRSRSRSPRIAKRKRSPSSDRHRGNRPDDRDVAKRTRHPQSPSQTSRYRDADPGPFHARSHRR